MAIRTSSARYTLLLVVLTALLTILSVLTASIFAIPLCGILSLFVLGREFSSTADDLQRPLSEYVHSARRAL